MSAATRVLSSTSLRTCVFALATLAGAAPAMADRDWNNHGRDRWRYGRDDWRCDTGVRSSFSISIGSGWNSCAPYYPRPVYVAPLCPPVRPIYIPPPVVYTPPVVYSQPVVYSPPPQVVYTQPQPVVIQQPQPQVIVQPAPQVVVQPAPAPVVVQSTPVVAQTIPAPAAPSRYYRDVAPSELAISAYRTGDTIMVLVNGSNTTEGFVTSLTVNDVNSDAPLVLHNEPPSSTPNLKATAFTLNASVRLNGNPTTIGVRVADRTYQVPIIDVKSVTGT